MPPKNLYLFRIHSDCTSYICVCLCVCVFKGGIGYHPVRDDSSCYLFSFKNEIYTISHGGNLTYGIWKIKSVCL